MWRRGRERKRRKNEEKTCDRLLRPAGDALPVPLVVRSCRACGRVEIVMAAAGEDGPGPLRKISTRGFRNTKSGRSCSAGVHSVPCEPAMPCTPAVDATRSSFGNEHGKLVGLGSRCFQVEECECELSQRERCEVEFEFVSRDRQAVGVGLGASTPMNSLITFTGKSPEEPLVHDIIGTYLSSRQDYHTGNARIS